LKLVIRLVQLRASSQRDRAADPTNVHYGRAEQITSTRAQVLDAAYATHPERFVGKLPRLPQVVWINKPLDPQEPPQQFPG
jgi:hypothetical protein